MRFRDLTVLRNVQYKSDLQKYGANRAFISSPTPFLFSESSEAATHDHKAHKFRRLEVLCTSNRFVANSPNDFKKAI